MNKKLLMTSVMVSAISISSFAASPYLSIGAGVSLLDDAEIGGLVDLPYDMGYNVEGAFGYAFNSWRAEIALGYETSDFEDANSGIELFSVMANGYYDFNTGSAFTPYLLAGLGVINAEIEEAELDADPVIGGQLGAGVGYALSENVIIDLKYKYFISDDLDFEGIDVSLGGHQFQLGARFQF